MTILVTGSAGFLGRHVTSTLAAEGHRVTGLDLRAADPAERGDIRSPLWSKRFSGVETVVHLAALGGVAPSLQRTAAYEITNVRGTGHVLEAASRAGVRRVVVASSSSIYGECPEPAAESRRPCPLSPYARTKVAAEACAASYAWRGLEVVVLRPFTVYGPGQRDDMLVARMLRGEAVTLWDFERDFTPVADVAAAIARAATVPMAGRYEVFNIGTGRPVTARALVDAVAEATGRRPEVSWGGRRPAEPVRTWADPSRARRVLGFEVTSSLAEGIAAQAEAQVLDGESRVIAPDSPSRTRTLSPA